MNLADLRQLAPARKLTQAEQFRVAELQANRVLAIAGITGPPVPTSAIRNLPRVALDYMAATPVSSSTHWTGSNWIIVVNADEPRTRRRFSAAHELFHVLDGPRRKRLGELHALHDPSIEAAANHFAACLLMPKRWVSRALFNEGVTTVRTLAALFDVSRQAMARRVDNLGLTQALSAEEDLRR